MGNGEARKMGTPVIQYNIQTNQKKVIAFIGPYYHEKYGYVAQGTFGIELSEDGSFLVIQTNGGFGPDFLNQRKDQPAIFVVHIPEAERQE